MRPNVDSRRRMISAYLKAEDTAGAERSLAQMEEKGVVPGLCCYSTMISAYAKVGDDVGAYRHLAKIEERGMRLIADSYTRVIE